MNSKLLKQNGDNYDYYKVSSAVHVNYLTSHVSSLFGDSSTADAAIIASGGISIPAHKLVLAAASPALKAILQVRK